MMPDQSRPFQIETDASKYATGAVLTQLDSNGDRYPVSFISKTFSLAERNYEIYDRELLVIIRVLEEWRHYIQLDPRISTYNSNPIWSQEIDLLSWSQESKLTTSMMVTNVVHFFTIEISSVKTQNIWSCWSQQISTFKQLSIPIPHSCLECWTTGCQPVSLSPHQIFKIFPTFQSLCLPQSWSLCIPSHQWEKGKVHRIMAMNLWELVDVSCNWDVSGNVSPELAWPSRNWPLHDPWKERYQGSKMPMTNSGFAYPKIRPFSGDKDSKHFRGTHHLAGQ